MIFVSYFQVSNCSIYFGFACKMVDVVLSSMLSHNGKQIWWVYKSPWMDWWPTTMWSISSNLNRATYQITFRNQKHGLDNNGITILAGLYFSTFWGLSDHVLCETNLPPTRWLPQPTLPRHGFARPSAQGKRVAPPHGDLTVHQKWWINCNKLVTISKYYIII